MTKFSISAEEKEKLRIALQEHADFRNDLTYVEVWTPSMKDAWEVIKKLTPSADCAKDGEPPCGDKCPKDEDCGNFDFHGEGCLYDPRLSKEKIWEAILHMSKAKFSYKVPMAADAKGAMLTAEQVSLIETVLLYAYHKAQNEGK